jgi:ribosomal protein S18 acetylase RimI-like enzyme
MLERPFATPPYGDAAHSQDIQQVMGCASRELRLGSSFERAIHLADGRDVHLRWIRSSDAPLIREGYARLSQQSRYTRFFTLMPALSDSFVRYLTEVDGFNHAALVALSGPSEAAAIPERGFGVARFIRDERDHTSAELAITVADDTQGHGLGHLLASTLATAARERCVETFTMSVLWSNDRVRSMLNRLGAKSGKIQGGIVDYSIATASLCGPSLGTSC